MDEGEVSEKVDSCLSRLMLWAYLYHTADLPPELAKRKVTLLEDVISDVQEICDFCVRDDS